MEPTTWVLVTATEVCPLVAEMVLVSHPQETRAALPRTTKALEVAPLTCETCAMRFPLTPEEHLDPTEQHQWTQPRHLEIRLRILRQEEPLQAPPTTALALFLPMDNPTTAPLPRPSALMASLQPGPHHMGHSAEEWPLLQPRTAPLQTPSLSAPLLLLLLLLRTTP